MRLVGAGKEGRLFACEMEGQGRGSVSPLRTRRRNRALGLSKTTLRSRVHVQTVGLNAATKKDRHRAGREVCLLTFLFIGRNRALGLSKTTLRSRVHVQTVGLNAATKKDRHRAGTEVCLSTFLFLGL